MVTIQEPVAVGDVRFGPLGPALVSEQGGVRGFSLRYGRRTAHFGPYSEGEVAAMPLLCPAKVRRGDVFEHPRTGPFTCREPGEQVGSWFGHDNGSNNVGLFPAVACLEGGWRIVSRGPMAAQTSPEEPVEVGQVRAWSHSDVRFLVNKHFDDGTAECVNAGDTWQRLDQSAIQRGSRVVCPAPERLRAGDRFVDVETGDIVLTDNGYGGYNINLSMDRKHVRDLCLHDGYRLASRGPRRHAPAGVEAGRNYATIDDLKARYLAAGIISQEEARGTRRDAVPHEPVKVGQVRLSANHGPVSVDNYHGFRVKTADGREVGGWWSQDAISAMPLLSPAWEDIRDGDVFKRGVLPDLVIDQRQHRPSVRDRCLDSGWCIVSRVPETREQVRERIAAQGITWKKVEVFVDQYESMPRVGRDRVAGIKPSGQVAAWLRDGTLSSEEAEKFVALKRHAPHSAILDHVEDPCSARIGLHVVNITALKATAARVRRTPWYRSPDSIRSANISAANEAQRHPHALVLQFGQRCGEVWDRYLRELSATLEWANARPEPIRLEAHHVLACVTGAVR